MKTNESLNFVFEIKLSLSVILIHAIILKIVVSKKGFVISTVGAFIIKVLK